MRRGSRIVVGWCVFFVACGGSTNDEKGTSKGTGGNSHNDAGANTGGSSGKAADSGGSAGSGNAASTGGNITSTGGKATGSGGVPGSGGESDASGGSAGTGGFAESGGSGAVGSGGKCIDPFCIPPPDPEPPGKALCGGAECAANEACCFATLKCFDPKNAPDACKGPPPPLPDPNGRPPCSSSADCADSEYCEQASYPFAGRAYCGGAGFCQSRTGCGSSFGIIYCGCDGRTYQNVQTPCFYGVRVANTGECGAAGQSGAVLCGTDAQCPKGEHCCNLTGECYTDAHAAICAYPPPGTSRICFTNADCYGEQQEYCAGDTCDGPGGCKPVGQCGALLEPVCGCDKQSYVNADCAASKGVRVATSGQCAR